MQLQDVLERTELRVFVDERGVQSQRRRRHERIGERNLVRRLRLRGLATQIPVRLVPLHGLVLHRFEQFHGLAPAEFLRRDVFQFGERNKGGMECGSGVQGLLEIRLNLIRTGFVLRPGEPRGGVQKSDLIHAHAPSPGRRARPPAIRCRPAIRAPVALFASGQ